MLINCPKCGFSQPKDRYCASCGVDMDNFRPKPAPWSKKFFNSPTTPVGLTVIIAIISVWYIRHQWKLASPPRGAESQKTFVGKAGGESGRRGFDSSAAADAEANSMEQAAAPAPPPPPPSSGPQMRMETRGIVAAAAKIGGEESDTGESAASNPLVSGSVPLRISFIEVPVGLLDFLLEEQRKAGASGVSRVHVQRLWSYVASNPESELYSMIQTFGGRQLSMKKNLGDSEDNPDGLSLNTSIQMRAPASASDAISGNLQMDARVKLDTQGSIHTKEKALNTIFSLKPGNYWIQKLDLPRGEPADARGLSGVQRVFQSPSFQNRETEVTLIIEVDRTTE